MVSVGGLFDQTAGCCWGLPWVHDAVATDLESKKHYEILHNHSDYSFLQTVNNKLIIRINVIIYFYTTRN